MVQVLNAPPKPFAWSFSAVDNFQTCPRKYYHQNILKDVSDDTSYRAEGGKLHDIMRDAVRGVAALPPHLKHWQRWVDELHHDKVHVTAEHKLAFTDRGEPCYYFAKRDMPAQPWCRTNLDVLKLYPHHALVWDWKTGKVKPVDDQLMLYALTLFIHYDTVEYVDAGLIFLKEDTGPHIPRNDCTYELRITRPDARLWWGKYMPKVRALEHAVRTNEWQPVSSGLCKNWCPVVSCEFNGHYGSKS